MPGNILSELAMAIRRTMSPMRGGNTNNAKNERHINNVNSEVPNMEQQKDKDNKDKNVNKISKDVAAMGLSETVMSRMKKGHKSFGDEDPLTRQNSHRKRKLKGKRSLGSSASPDIHPELTLKQVQKGALTSAKPVRQSSCETNTLEINTMFEPSMQHSISSSIQCRNSRPRFREGRRSTWHWQNNCPRRSSVAAMGNSAKRSEKESLIYFPHSPRLQPQSSSAVHYLAISPPRIRITDEQGTPEAKSRADDTEQLREDSENQDCQGNDTKVTSASSAAAFEFNDENVPEESQSTTGSFEEQQVSTTVPAPLNRSVSTGVKPARSSLGGNGSLSPTGSASNSNTTSTSNSSSSRRRSSSDTCSPSLSRSIWSSNRSR